MILEGDDFILRDMTKVNISLSDAKIRFFILTVKKSRHFLCGMERFLFFLKGEMRGNV